MRKKQYQIQLKEEEYTTLTAMLNKGEGKARVLRRCNILLLANAGQDNRMVARNLQISEATVVHIKKRYLADGITAAINERPRPGAKYKIPVKDRARVTAIACSTPPEGHARWTLRLLAEKVVELELADSISHVCIGALLKKTNCSLI